MDPAEILRSVVIPSVSSATFATMGYVTMIRLRRGVFPSNRVVSKQLGYSLMGCIAVSSVLLEHRRNSRAALMRMMRTAESSMELDFRDPSSHVVRVEEYDEATGVDGEKITRVLMQSLQNRTHAERN